MSLVRLIGRERHQEHQSGFRSPDGLAPVDAGDRDFDHIPEHLEPVDDVQRQNFAFLFVDQAVDRNTGTPLNGRCGVSADPHACNGGSHAPGAGRREYRSSPLSSPGL
ncbi:hypothetical protein L3V59_35180 [Burkholderia aenigmatica]|uniref:hypothetical protein n=1 Tax=Burkholderia aenigmatica TaxID=2015348 RepID=UPI001F43CA14|nr:hypothetical protein [Burkholderia aenigmatica]UKD17214.1 hypothetical protein L3V59_35180 [Burkholderia aenigmatica]